MGETTVKLRVQELRRPAIRKFQRKLEYGLNKAFEQCQVAYDLAYEKADAGGILKAVEMQAKLAKLLTDHIDVTHRRGVLDDTSTEMLLEMKMEIEVRRAKQKKLLESRVVNSETVSGTPHAPSLESQIGSHLLAVASFQGPEVKFKASNCEGK